MIKCSLCGRSSKKIKYHKGKCTDPETNITENLIVCDICYKELERDAKDTEEFNKTHPGVIP